MKIAGTLFFHCCAPMRQIHQFLIYNDRNWSHLLSWCKRMPWRSQQCQQKNKIITKHKPCTGKGSRLVWRLISLLNIDLNIDCSFNSNLTNLLEDKVVQFDFFCTPLMFMRGTSWSWESYLMFSRVVTHVHERATSCLSIKTNASGQN